jgi:hypothetical protein
MAYKRVISYRRIILVQITLISYIIAFSKKVINNYSVILYSFFFVYYVLLNTLELLC